MRRLLRRAALAVDAGADDRLGKASRKGGVAADVQALLARLHDATHDHVLDQRRVEVVALDQGTERLRREVDRMPVLQLPVALPSRGADGIDDDGGAVDGSAVDGGAIGHAYLLETFDADTRPNGQLRGTVAP